jgi:Spy/CpxP family protein refolding chaperone
MPTQIWLKLAAAALAVGVSTSGAALRAGWAQHGMPPSGGGGPPPHMPAEMCASASEKNIGDGRGFGMAFVADQQGYPGPLHVLELKDRLKLTPDQETRAQALLAAMFAESRPKSERLLEAERKLRSLFSESKADEASIRAAVAEVERARSDVRLVHLMFHLKTRDVLTDEQRRLYHEARWSGHRPMGPHGGGSPGAGSPMK